MRRNHQPSHEPSDAANMMSIRDSQPSRSSASQRSTVRTPAAARNHSALPLSDKTTNTSTSRTNAIIQKTKSTGSSKKGGYSKNHVRSLPSFHRIIRFLDERRSAAKHDLLELLDQATKREGTAGTNTNNKGSIQGDSSNIVTDHDSNEGSGNASSSNTSTTPRGSIAIVDSLAAQSTIPIIDAVPPSKTPAPMIDAVTPAKTSTPIIPTLAPDNARHGSLQPSSNMITSVFLTVAASERNSNNAADHDNHSSIVQSKHKAQHNQAVQVDTTPTDGSSQFEPESLAIPTSLLDHTKLSQLIIECLLSGSDDSRIVSLMHLVGWSERTWYRAFAAVSNNPFERLVQQSYRLAQRHNTTCIIGRNDDDMNAAFDSRLLGEGHTATGVVGIIAIDMLHRGDTICRDFQSLFDSPCVFGSLRQGTHGASISLSSALSTMSCVPALNATSYPLYAEDALPERALLGDDDARWTLCHEVYGSLLGEDGDTLLIDTVHSYVLNGNSLDKTAQALTVHPNTVRYRLRKVHELSGWDPTLPRDSYILHTAIVLGRILGI